MVQVCEEGIVVITSELDSTILRPLRGAGTIPQRRLSREFLRVAAKYPGLLRNRLNTTEDRQYLYEFPGDLTHMPRR